MLERMILYSSYIVIVILILWLVPKHKTREAFVIFLFKQVLTWVFGLLVVQYKLIEYPVRFFSYASRSSFTFEYFVYPAVCIFFNIYYPFKKAWWIKFFHYVKFSSLITVIELVLERYTELIVYIKWEWYLTWITLFFTFYLSNKFYRWFFKLP